MEYRANNINTNELKLFLQDMLVLAAGRTIQPEAPLGVDQRIINAIAPDNSPETKKEMKETLEFAKTDANYETVTIEATPEEAQILIYVMSVYKELQVVLRNPDDRKTERRTTTNMRDVMGEDSYYVKHRQLPPPALVPQPEGYDFVGGRAVPY
jgi:Flp pilus assembly protein CpaB